MKILPIALAAAVGALVLGKKKKKRKKNGAATWKERQRALAMLGFYDGEIDGQGQSAEMKASIMTFQVANLVRPTGTWNEATQRALEIALSRHAQGTSGGHTIVVVQNEGETVTVGKDFDRYVLGEFIRRRYASGKLLSSIGAPAAYGEFMSTVYAVMDGKPVLLKNLPETDAVKAFNESVFAKINDLRNFAIEVQEKKASIGLTQTESWFAQVAPNIPIIGPMWGGIDKAWTEFFGKE